MSKRRAPQVGAGGRPATRRRGMTLMELLLVLALLVAAAALSIPALQGPLDDYRLMKAAELVRAEWTRARIRAMETGRTYMFRYEPGGRRFQIEPWYGESDYLEADLETLAQDPSLLDPSRGATPATPLGAAPAAGGQTASFQLPEGVVFHAGSVDWDQRTAALADELQALASSSDAWAPPVLFYPDGASSDAEVTLNNERGGYVIVRLRGLTGLAQISDLLTETEAQP